LYHAEKEDFNYEWRGEDPDQVSLIHPEKKQTMWRSSPEYLKRYNRCAHCPFYKKQDAKAKSYDY
jgi:hypothetical protein